MAYRPRRRVHASAARLECVSSLAAVSSLDSIETGDKRPHLALYGQRQTALLGTGDFRLIAFCFTGRGNVTPSGGSKSAAQGVMGRVAATVGANQFYEPRASSQRKLFFMITSRLSRLCRREHVSQSSYTQPNPTECNAIFL